MKRPSKPWLALIVALAIACLSGFLTAKAVAEQRSQTRTVTVNVATGPRGPAGPPGPKGDTGPAGFECPAHYSPGELVIDHPGGQVRTWTCLHD